MPTTQRRCEERPVLPSPSQPNRRRPIGHDRARPQPRPAPRDLAQTPVGRRTGKGGRAPADPVGPRGRGPTPSRSTSGAGWARSGHTVGQRPPRECDADHSCPAEVGQGIGQEAVRTVGWDTWPLTDRNPPVTSAFRHHDHVPPQIASPYYARLVQEWIDLNAQPGTANTVHSWARAEPVLAGCARPGDVVDAIDAAPADGKDAILLALIRLTQGGEQLAGRIVLQAMLPKLGRLTNRTGPTSSRRRVGRGPPPHRRRPPLAGHRRLPHPAAHQEGRRQPDPGDPAPDHRRHPPPPHRHPRRARDSRRACRRHGR